MLSLRDDPLLKDIPEVDGFKVLEPCVLYSKLGEGGMGAVYRGRHLNLDIDVAVKCLRGALADQSVAFVQRFQREARLAAGIHHQNLVQVYDVSQKSGVHYLVMEFVHGETARDRVKRKGRLGIDEALRIALGAATGLGEAHGRKIVHRDVKPDNVLIGRDGSVKVSDLGLAKAIESEVDVSLTQGVMGTPQYMAPEQWEDSSSVTPAADVWALGATIWFLLVGSDPIRKGTLQQVYKAVCVEPFPDLRVARPEVPEAIVKLVERCVARDPKQRFADCREVRDELRGHVGVDRGELVSQPGETTQMGATLVSPPPPATMARIRSQVESRTDFKPELQAATLPMTPAAPGTATGAPRPATAPGAAPAQRPRLLWLAGGGVAVAAIAIVAYALGGGDDAKPGAKGSEEPSKRIANGAVDPKTPPSEDLPMRVQVDSIDDETPVRSSDTRRFSLTGGISGNAKKLVARIREKGGSVKYIQQGSNRFRLDLSFDADGVYTLEFDGPQLEGLRQITLTVDATKPVLVRRTESPEAPLARGKTVRLRLEFDEPLASAEIAGRRAEVDGKIAELRAESPSTGSDWVVPWEAVDLVGNTSTNRFTIALEEPAKPDGDPSSDGGSRAEDDTAGRARRSDSPPPPPKPDPDPAGRNAAPPPGFVALGGDTRAIAGRAWPLRVQHEQTKIVFVLIPPGEFRMGSNDPEDNTPAPRSVTIARGFYMAENEVSIEEYRQLVPAKDAGEDGRMPVGNLTFEQAQDFCRTAGLALPSEAEWEYACRAGKETRRFAFGDALDPERFAVQGKVVQKRPCGFSPRNEFGLSDMHGNMFEYCVDGFLSPADYGKLQAKDLVVTKPRSTREAVLRGGSFRSKPERCGSASRLALDRRSTNVEACGLRPIWRLP